MLDIMDSIDSLLCNDLLDVTHHRDALSTLSLEHPSHVAIIVIASGFYMFECKKETHENMIF